MFSRTLRRALVEHKAQLPPTFLLPWSARLSTASQIDAASTTLPPPQSAAPQSLHGQVTSASRAGGGEGAQAVRDAAAAQSSLASSNHASPAQVSSSVRELLPLLRAQAPHYITVHIHGFPYLVTQGDTIRLPFLMHGVQPGDVLRLNRAINLGSRDFTLKAPTPESRSKQTEFQATAEARLSTSALTPDSPTSSANLAVAPHYIPHIAKGKHAYLDERLFVCRAVVMGVETEPLRMKEKTKRRQRHVHTIKSKHQSTILKIKELSVNGAEALGAEQAL